jgi:hypothetical protein
VNRYHWAAAGTRRRETTKSTPGGHWVENKPFDFVGLTYDDVMLLPAHTDVIPSQAETSSAADQADRHARSPAVRGHGHRD